MRNPYLLTLHGDVRDSGAVFERGTRCDMVGRYPLIGLVCRIDAFTKCVMAAWNHEWNQPGWNQPESSCDQPK